MWLQFLGRAKLTGRINHDISAKDIPGNFCRVIGGNQAALHFTTHQVVRFQADLRGLAHGLVEQVMQNLGSANV